MRAPPISFTAFCRLLGVRLTPGQRALAMVLFDGAHPADLPSDVRPLGRRLFGDVGDIPPAARHVAVVVAGARGGKTYMSALRAVHLALTVPLDTLAPGELAAGIIVAPDLRLARQALRFAAGAVRGRPELAAMVAGDTADGLTLRRPDGRVVEVAALPAAEAGRSLRGRTLAFAVFDESAFFYSDGYAVADVDLFRAVAPRVVPDGQILVASTPWGHAGLLYELHRDNFGAPRSALVAHAPTLLLRDDASTRAIVEREQRRDPANAAIEFGAEFGQNDSALLDPADIEAAVGDYDEQPRVEGVAYTPACIDLATRSDYSVAVVGHRELRARRGAPPVDVLVVDCARHWAPSVVGRALKRKVDVDDLEVEIAQLARHYRSPRLVADSWGFDFFESRMRKRGVPIEQADMTPSAQAHRASLLSMYFRQRRVVLPRNAEMVRQLKAIRVTRSAGGGVRFAAPNRRGQHDDYPKALMLLVERAAKVPPSGGDVRMSYAVDGTERWFRREGSGWIPSEPPIGTGAWFELVDRAQREGFATASIEMWLSEPGNVEALQRWREQDAATRSIAAVIGSR